MGGKMIDKIQLDLNLLLTEFEQNIETLFDPTLAVDVCFDIALKATKWPIRDYSIKSLAKYLGFQWRDTNPSGLSSIEWFDRWIHIEDPEIWQRILD